MKRLLLWCLCCLVAATARGELALISRETFQGIGTLDANSPGNLGTVETGVFYKRPVGPRLAADASANARGWSADARNQIRMDHVYGPGPALPDTASDVSDGVFAFDWWVYLDAPATDGSKGQQLTAMYERNGRCLFRVLTSAAD